MTPQALIAHRFESNDAAKPGEAAHILWSPACACRLVRIEYQPGPVWQTTVEISRQPVKLRLDGSFPPDTRMLPGTTLRIEYRNAGDAPAVGRVTLWIDIHGELGP